MEKLLVWDITSNCNLRCRHCYNGDLYFKNKIIDLTLEEKLDMIRKVAKSGFKYLSLLGGEPLISEGLDEILKEAKNCGLKVFITTNGTLMNDDVIDLEFPQTVIEK